MLSLAYSRTFLLRPALEVSLRSSTAQIGIVDILISFQQVNKLFGFIDADEEIGSEDTASEDPEEASEDDSLSDIITRAQGDLGSVLQTPAPRRRPTHTGGKTFSPH
jgi:hypothetical protein